MPAGMTYNLNPLETEKELYRVETGYRLSGGFNLDDDKLVEGSYLPVLAPLAIDFSTRKAKAVKNVKVYENALSNATSIKIEKNSLAYANMYIGNGSKAAQVTAIDKTNASYDVLTVTLGAAVTAGNILMETASSSSITAAVKGVYELTIGTNATAGDKISVGGIEFEFAAAPAEGKVVVGATAAASAANLDSVLEQELTLTAVYDITYKGAKITFTQKVGGTGAIPALVVTPVAETGTLAATIAQVTAGVAGSVTEVTEPKNVAKFLNYARTKVESGASVDALGIALEIKESILYVPISASDKVNMREAGSHFMFV